MKKLALLPLVLVCACTSGPSKSEATQVYAAATTAMASAQASAVSQARAHASLVPAALALDFSGPCALGGTVAVTGSYDGAGTGSAAVFDLATTFTQCQAATGTLDGNVHWTSTASGTSFSASMTGDLDFTGAQFSASCHLDLQFAVDPTSVTASGSICGYDVQADLHV